MRYWSTRNGGGGSCCSSIGRAVRRCWTVGAIRGLSRWPALLALALLSNWSLCAGTLTLGWQPSAGASAYRLYYSVDANPFSLVALTTNTTAAVTVADVTNRWYVTATNIYVPPPTNGESDLSNVVTVGPGITLPPPTNTVIPPPTRLLVSSVQGNRLTLVWTASDQRYSTRIERAPPNGAFTVIGTAAAGVSQFQTMARKQDSWVYRVRSCEGSTCSEPSAPLFWDAH